MKNDRVMLSPDEVNEMLPQKEYIHTFRNPIAGTIIGADYRREALIELVKKVGVAELSGVQASSLGHGIALQDTHGWLFIETADIEAAACEKA